MNRRHALALIATSSAIAAVGARAAIGGPWVAAMRRGGSFGIDAVVIAPVTPREAWDVLTDFDAMANFVPNLEASHVTARNGSTLRVEQRRLARWGPVAKTFNTVREVVLVPTETVTSVSVEGSVPRIKSVTQFKAVPGGTEIWHRAELDFETWMPDFVAERLLQDDMNEQLEAAVAEMMRRRAAGGN
jgi:ribosome-associated toxin RatA of RatAB toxin-antitoxin module